MNKRLVLVTGATGALGPSLVTRLLAEGCQVRALVRETSDTAVLPEQVEFVFGDVTDEGAVVHAVDTAVRGVDAVFHLAAKLHINNPSPELAAAYEAVNVGGTRRLVEAAQAADVARFVFFSTISVYGPTAQGQRPLSETAPIKPVTIYGKTKAEAEQIVLAATRSDREPWGVVLRLAAVYGARVKGNYARLLQAVNQGWFVPVGKGENRRTLVYDVDVAQAAWLAATHPDAPGNIYNVTDGQIHTLSEILAVLRDVAGKKPSQYYVPEGPVRLSAGLMTRASRLVGKPVPFDALLAKYLEDVAVDGQKLLQDLEFKPAFDLSSGWQDAVRQKIRMMT